MKILKKTIAKKTVRKIILVVFIVVVAVSGCLLYRYYSSIAQNKPSSENGDVNSKIDLRSPSEEQKDAGDIQKEIEALGNSDVSASNVLSVALSSKNVTVDLIQIRYIISGTISNMGKCNLTLTSGDKQLSMTSTTYALPSSSTCRGFDINRSELANGTWIANLTVDIGSKTTTTSSEILLE